MRTVLITYATHEGHTRDVAERLAFTLGKEGLEVTVHDLSAGPIDPMLFDRVVLAASVQLGRHHRRAVKFAKSQRQALEAKDAIFISVGGATAAAEHAEDPLKVEQFARDAKQAVDLFIIDSGWTPRHVEFVAGAFLYRQYNWLLRLIMRRIAKSEGLSTDTSKNHDYTNWAAIDRLATELGSEAPPSPS